MRPVRIVLQTAAALCLAAATTAAQEPDCVVPAPRDSVTVSVIGAVTQAHGTALQGVFTDVLLAEIGNRLQVPRPLPIDTYFPRDVRELRYPNPATPALSAAVSFQLRRGLPANDVTVITGSLSPGFDSALVDAVRRTIADSAILALPENVGADSVRFRFTVDSRVTPPTGATTLFRMRAPLVAFTAGVAPRGTNLPPRYPEALRARKAEGQVRMQFVVDADGLVAPGTLRILDASEAAFIAPVATVLPFYRFRPALVSGCPVATIVQMPFRFTIRDSRPVRADERPAPAPALLALHPHWLP